MDYLTGMVMDTAAAELEEETLKLMKEKGLDPTLMCYVLDRVRMKIGNMKAMQYIEEMIDSERKET